MNPSYSPESPNLVFQTPDKLNFGRDYDNEEIIDLINNSDIDLIPKEPPLLGLKDGIKQEDLDADKTINTNNNPFWGTTDVGRNMYNNIY